MSTRVKIRFFTIADYEDEERWLTKMHKDGWKLAKMVIPCFYFFEKCEPEDVIYRLDFQNNREHSDYYQLFSDYGWEYFARCMGWLYFRKPAAEADEEQDGEIFSDKASRIDMINHIMKTRMLPLIIIFCCCLLPQCFRSFHAISSGTLALNFISVLLLILLVIYIYLFIHCGRKLHELRRLYNEYSE